MSNKKESYFPEDLWQLILTEVEEQQYAKPKRV